MKKITTAALICAASAVNAQTIVHEFGGLNDTSEDLLIGLGTGDYSTTSAVFSRTGDTVGIESFDYTLTISAGTGVTDVSTGAGGILNNGSQFGDGDTVTFSVVVDSGNVVFDGFTNFGTNFGNASGEGFTVAGVSYVQGTSVNGDSDPRHGIAISGGIIASDTVDWTAVTVDGVSLRGFALQFSAVPEPNAYGLIAGLLSVGAIVSQRRRK